MPTSVGAEVDFIEELKLRRWAREHYVPTDRRENSWHPLVLDEMRRKDLEREEAQTVFTCA
jgi:hypothetical protein